MPAPRKRSAQVRLLLLGGLAGGALPGCSEKAPVLPPPEVVYPNNHYMKGLGYYHAPFQSWYAEPYNKLNEADGRYYYAGDWHGAPYLSPINLSVPTPEARRALQALLPPPPAVQRSGFGSTHRSFSSFSS